MWGDRILPGIVKRKYNHQTILFIKQNFTGPLRAVAKILPLHYDGDDILTSFKCFYPRQWRLLESRYIYYQEKDRFLKKIGKKARYFHKKPVDFFFSLQKVKHLLSNGMKTKHQKNFDEDGRGVLLKKMEKKRKIVLVDMQGAQSLEPVYFDLLVYSYHKRGVTHEDKLEIVKEIQKFRGKRITRFFQKLNDSERNNQIRRMAFEHLQSIGEFVFLRKGFKGKAKEYSIARSEFAMTPKDLIDRIDADTIQSKKEYDVFLSHSFKDIGLVEKIKDALNARGISVYCDWMSDNDFLKREMLSKYTELVLQKRIEQSKVVVLVQTENSISENGKQSPWIKMELEHAQGLHKEIFTVNFSKQQAVFRDLPFVEKEEEVIFDELSQLGG